MAEAIVNARRGDVWQAFSAGTRPAAYVHPKALEALSEIDIQHEGRSKSVDEYRHEDFDLVVTVCDSAAVDCPVWLGSGKKVHQAYPDPALRGLIEDFRTVRDAMESEIIKLLDGYEN